MRNRDWKRYCEVVKCHAQELTKACIIMHSIHFAFHKKIVLILMPVFHDQDLFSSGSHLKGFSDPPHSDQLRKYFG